MATWWTVLALVGYLLLPGSHIDGTAVYGAMLVGAAAGALIVPAMPWPDLFRSVAGDVALAAWSVADIVMISAGVAVTGGSTSPLVLLYCLTTIFFAASYRRAAQILLFGFTVASLSTAAVIAGDPSIAALVAETAILGVMAFMGEFLSSGLQDEAHAHAHARAEAERRADVLAAVAAAGREISVLQTDAVFDAVMDGLEKVGFEAADLCLVDEGEVTYEVLHARNLPDDYTRRPHPATQGMISRVIDERRTVVVDYRSVAGGVDTLRDVGFRAVVGVPIWDHDRLVGVLEAGTRGRVELRREEVEAAELLALQAGRALQNAQRFAVEHRMVEQLSDLNRLKEEFLSTVSHELRTPLTVIAGMGQSLERRWDTLDPETRVDLLQRLNANTVSLTRIVGELLDFSHLGAHELQASLEALDVRSVMQGVLHRMASLLNGHVVHVELNDVPLVSGDSFLLERVCENLLSNAARHTPAGTSVWVTARTVDRQVEVCVADAGPGIPPGDLALVGTRFFRGATESVHRNRGLGLGLAFVKEILELHGSELRIESRPGEGARFRFRLPVVPIRHEPVDPLTRIGR